MRKLLPLTYAIEEAEDSLRKLKAVFERQMEAIEYGYPVELDDTERELLRVAKVSAYTSAKYLAEFEGGTDDA